MPHSLQIIRKMLPYTSVAAVLALLYLGWVFYARSSQNSELQREADAKAAEEARKTTELYGGEQLKILLLYATPAKVTRGSQVELCYGVSNATSVKFEPSVEDVKPSLNRCVAVTPLRSTTYTLTASDDKGNRTTKSVDVAVR